MELISVIVPIYNRERFLEETIKSVLGQTDTNWELILIDDHSTDESWEIARRHSLEHPGIQAFKRPEGLVKGANSCRNFGFEMSSGVYLKFLDSDDLLQPNALEIQRAAINDNSVEVVISQTEFFEDTGVGPQLLDRYWSHNLMASNLIVALANGSVRWQTAAPLWRRSTFTDPPFKIGLMNSQEWLLHLCYAARSKKMEVLDKVVVLARVHSDSMSSGNNKKASYYYHASMARYYAIMELSKRPIPKRKAVLKMLFKRFSWYHAFILYKGGIAFFVKLLAKYPKVLIQLLKA